MASVPGLPLSLLLLIRFPSIRECRPLLGDGPPAGTGGATPRDGFDKLIVDFSTRGADRSLVTVFFRFVPFVMSVSNAP